MASKLKNRRSFLTGLTIQAPCASTETECHELHAKYVIGDEILGQGTTAVVKTGTQKQSGLPVAIKEIKTYGDEELCEAVRKEFKIMKSLNHPNIVKMHDLYFTPNMTKAYLCMDLVRGGTLQGAVERHGKISEATMRPLFEQLASALSYLHCKRITHRDLKPDNLLVSESLDKLYICDFNYARKLADGCTLTNRVGAMAFASPEMLLGTGILGEQMDIWSVGLCLYFALSGGCTPTKGKKGFADQKAFGEYLANANAAERLEWIRLIGLSKESLVAQVLWACLNPDPSKRPDAMLLLAHPWVSPTDDMDEDSAQPPIRRTASDACHFAPQSRKSCMASRSQRLCAHGLVLEEPPLSDRSDSEASTMASSTDASPCLPLNATWNTVPKDADLLSQRMSCLRRVTID